MIKRGKDRIIKTNSSRSSVHNSSNYSDLNVSSHWLDLGSRVRIHPIISQKRTLGQRSADKLAELAGSWWFIFIFLSIMVIWVIINIVILTTRAFDPYPFILLNLGLSCLAALQAPVILMSQNRQAERDRTFARYDHHVNFKAEREIQDMQKDLDEIKQMIKDRYCRNS